MATHLRLRVGAHKRQVTILAGVIGTIFCGGFGFYYSHLGINSTKQVISQNTGAQQQGHVGTAQPVQSSASQKDGTLDPNAVVSNQVETQIVNTVGKLPFITDVYIAETKDGRYVVSAQADLSQNVDQASIRPSSAATALDLAKRFTESVYGLKLPIGESNINVLNDGSNLMSVSLGWLQEKQKPNFSKMSETEFTDWLNQNTHLDNDLENNTFYTNY